MSQPVAKIFFSFLVTIVLCAPPGARAATDFDGAALTEKLETIRADANITGFAIGVISDETLVYAHGFGELKMESGKRVTAQSNFHWASVSKPFVATAIMQLAERGALDLDAKLVEVLTGYEAPDARINQITLRQLMTHTSGLPDIDDFNWDKPEYDDAALGRWALRDSPRKLLFNPGTDREYSNIGFEILGAVIEQVSGDSFEQYMKENVFIPLNMTHTTFFYPETAKGRRTSGHVGKGASKHVIQNYPYNRRHAPSSTLNTNIDDMARYAQALLNGGTLEGERVLRPETIQAMWAPQWTIDDANAATLGWVRQMREGKLLVRHFGWDDGYRSALILLPEEKQAIFVVTNDEETAIGDLVIPALASLAAQED